MISNISNNSIGNANLKLVLGIVVGVLLSGIVYGMLSLSSSRSTGDNAASVENAPKEEVFYSINTEPIKEPEPPQPQPSVAATPPPPTQTMAAVKPVEPVAEAPEPEETQMETDETYALEEYEYEQAEKRLREIQQLKEALPNNLLIPFERTPEEAEELLAYGQEISDELNTIKQSIDDNTATSADRQRYFDIVSKQFDDEIELINYCSELVSDPNSGSSNELCSGLSKQGEQRIQEVELAKERLRKELMQEK